MSTTPAPNFDKLAPIYRWMEWLTFGPCLHRARTAFLPELTTAKHALILGDGDGRFTAALLRANPAIRIDAIDASPAMLQALIRRAGRKNKSDAARVHPQTADARTFQPNPATPYDLVVTHFFLDCLTTAEIETLAATLRPHLTSNARWLLSDFAIPATPYGRWFARPLIAFLYQSFALLTHLRIRRLPDHPTALSRANFTLHAAKNHLFGLLRSEIWHAERPGSNVKAMLKSLD